MPPFSIKPAGNLLVRDPASPIRSIDRASGLGPVLARIDDAKLASALLGALAPAELLSLASASKAWYVLVHYDPDLLKELALNILSPDVLSERLVKYPASWKSVLVGRNCTGLALKGQRFHSDVLYLAWQCRTSGIDPAWLAVDNATRCSAPLATEEFISRYESPRIPVVITGLQSHFQKGIERWKDGMLAVAQSNEAKSWAFRAGPVTLSLLALATMSIYTEDESPLYIFDARFAKAAPLLAEDYTVPSIFKGKGRDLFEYMGDNRPDYRWIIGGPAKSGSKWHVDPNTTHAWNCALLGRKRWLMLPPGPPPPGVFASADGGSVAQPVSLIEWYINFYAETRRQRKDLIEFTVGVGELVFVPSGWWHAVLNLDECVAMTQNYIAEQTNLRRALAFFKHKPDQISGIPAKRKATFGDEFTEALRANGVELPEGAEASAAPWSGLVKRAKPFTFGF